MVLVTDEVKLFSSIIFPILDLYLWRLLPRLAFMVAARVALKGLWISFTHFVVGGGANLDFNIAKVQIFLVE